MNRKFLGTVLLPGTYDPVTIGHMNSLKYLSERSDKVISVIMTLSADEKKRWIPSEDMKALLEEAIKKEGLDNVSVYIEKEGWIANTIEHFKADGVARSFHPNISVNNEIELINAVIDLNVPVHIIPSKLDVRSSNIKFFAEENMLHEFKDQLPENVYNYILKYKCLNLN